MSPAPHRTGDRDRPKVITPLPNRTISVSLVTFAQPWDGRSPACRRPPAKGIISSWLIMFASLIGCSPARGGCTGTQCENTRAVDTPRRGGDETESVRHSATGNGTVPRAERNQRTSEVRGLGQKEESWAGPKTHESCPKGQDNLRLHIYGHKQRLPQWARAALHPAIRDKLDGDLLGWRKTLQKDPCSYCGGTGGEADHIVARRNGGRDRWLNLAGTCERCNRAKGTRSLLAFAAGLHREMELNGAPLARFGGLTVATANLDEATGSGQPDRWGDKARARGAPADAARGRRSRGLPLTPPGTRAATSMDPCARHAGGRSRRRGGMPAAGRRRKQNTGRSRERRAAVRAD